METSAAADGGQFAQVSNVVPDAPDEAADQVLVNFNMSSVMESDAPLQGVALVSAAVLLFLSYFERARARCATSTAPHSGFCRVGEVREPLYSRL